jgi:hypothetical protein
MAQPQGARDAVTADPQHYTVEVENEQVRVLRVRYGPVRHLDLELPASLRRVGPAIWLAATFPSL